MTNSFFFSCFFRHTAHGARWSKFGCFVFFVDHFSATGGGGGGGQFDKSK
jgi:hypothetical protein